MAEPGPALSRNLAAYLGYQTARNGIAWLPVFFLYMSSTLSVDAALILESIYYAVVVVLEVPSGYLSDRLGRRPTMVLGMMCWCAAGLVFAATASFPAFVVAQALMAAGMALNSGTDEALLYDTLVELERGEEFVDFEARAQARAKIATGVAALVGGAVAVVDYRGAYLVSAASAAIAIGFALRMVEPSRSSAAPPLQQLGGVLRRLKQPMLAWLLAFAVAMTVFDHVAYMFIQPYLELLELPSLGGEASTPLASGIVTAVTLGLAALAARGAPVLQRRLGPATSLLSAMAFHGVVIAAMAAVVHPLVVGLVALRALPPVIWKPIAHGLAHPRVPSAMRATYFSVESLVGRLAFSASLAMAAWTIGSLESPSPDALREVLTAFATAVLGALIVLGVTVGVLRRDEPSPDDRGATNSSR